MFVTYLEKVYWRSLEQSWFGSFLCFTKEMGLLAFLYNSKISRDNDNFQKPVIIWFQKKFPKLFQKMHRKEQFCRLINFMSQRVAQHILPQHCSFTMTKCQKVPFICSSLQQLLHRKFPIVTSRGDRSLVTHKTMEHSAKMELKQLLQISLFLQAHSTKKKYTRRQKTVGHTVHKYSSSKKRC